MTITDIEALSGRVEAFNQGSVLCVGDVILDNFIYGHVDRVSPEAPVPILRIKHEALMLGGAGNVVRNVVSLGAKACFVSVVGNDKVGQKLTELIGKEPAIEAYLQSEKNRISTAKTRYIAGNQQLLRADHETTEDIKPATEKTILQLIKSSLKHVDVVVLSDYAKGVLTPTLIKDIIMHARKADKTIIVDPKQMDFVVYHGATIITPNASELSSATNMPVSNDEEVELACKQLIELCDVQAVLVTRSKEGMSLVGSDGNTQHFAAATQEVFDVSGAGDTVVACLATAIAAGLTLEEAVYLGNIAAGIVVGRIGTSQVHRTDLKTALLTRDLVSGTHKILPQDTAKTQIQQWKEQDQTIGFTNGCFDLIHPGHISLMDQAKATCDKLVVGLNSDDSVRRLKGEQRPVQNEMSRALVLASLAAVDLVVIFREDTPVKLIESFQPDILIKGADYKKEEVVGADIVESYGGKIVLADLSEGQSTSNIVKKISA